MSLPDRERLKALIRRYLPYVVALLAAGGVTVAVTTSDDNHDGRIDHTTVAVTTPRGSATVTLGGQGNKTITLTPAAQKVAAQQAADDRAGKDVAAESDLHEDTKPTAGALKDGNAAAPADQPAIPKAIPQAAPEPPAGCFDAFVRNQSSRNGAKIALGVIHWTGSANIANSKADVLGNVHWFDTPAAQASSNYIVDDDGNCAYTVPETAKAWTQAAANPWSVSVEFTNPGILPLFHGLSGRDRVLELMRGWHKRWGIPYRRGAVNASCVPTRSGFLAHRDLGACGGGHPDVGPSPATVDALIRDAAAGDHPVTATDRVTCRKLNWWRAHGRPHGKAETNAVRRRKALAARHVTCTARGPVRA